MRRVVELTSDAVAGAETVLEVGAGTGLITAAIASRVRQVVATDYARAMLDRLRQRIERAHLANVQCSVADIYDLGYPANSFDAVVAANVLHLVADVTSALAALRVVLRPGGKLVAPTFCHDETLLARFSSRLLALTGFPAQRRFSARSLRAELEGAGLTVVRQETVPGWIPIAFIDGKFE
jgi:ubiquinone/menaquinone biosynthesis C-methylase UbiE